jgi:hypothetical protein
MAGRDSEPPTLPPAPSRHENHWLFTNDIVSRAKCHKTHGISWRLLRDYWLLSPLSSSIGFRKRSVRKELSYGKSPAMLASDQLCFHKLHFFLKPCFASIKAHCETSLYRMARYGPAARTLLSAVTLLITEVAVCYLFGHGGRRCSIGSEVCVINSLDPFRPATKQSENGS